MEQLILIIVLVVGFGAVLYLLNQRLKELKSSSAVELLKTDVTELSRNMGNLQQTVGEKLDNNNSSMQALSLIHISEPTRPY